MSEWKAKVFWKSTDVVEKDNAYSVTLDGRPIKTPGKAALAVPTRALAQAMAEEWAAQTDEIRPDTMPLTKSANSAVDKVSVQFDEVADMLANYAGTDLLCYRATSPSELMARQSEKWDPLLDWCATRYDAPLTPVAGVMFQSQPAQSLARLKDQVHAMDNFTLTGFHELVTLSGSLVLGLAVLENHVTPEDAWALSRLDELYQQEQWGVDEEAEEMADVKKHAFIHGKRFCDLLRK